MSIPCTVFCENKVSSFARMKLSRLGDILAIPCFLLLMFYFMRKETLTEEEKVLFAFSITGFFADVYFVWFER